MSSDAPPTAAQVQRVYAAHRSLFETVEVAGLACADRAAAERLAGDLRAGRCALDVDVPAEPTVLDAPAASGYFGLVTRADLPPELAEAAFADGAGDVVGPVAYAGRHWVLQLLLPRRVELSPTIYDYCVGLLDPAGSTRGGT